MRIPYQNQGRLQTNELVHNDYMSPIFMAAIEATEEAILNSMFMAKTMKGMNGTIEALPLDKVLPILKERGAIRD